MRHLVLFGGLLAAAAVVMSACSAADDPAAGMLAAVNVIDGAGFHGIDEALAKPGAKVDAAWLGKTRNARIAIASASWPKDLDPEAKAFVAAAARLQAALEKDDATAAAAPAHDTHEAQHELTASTYNYLAGKAGIPQTKSDD